MSRKTVEKGLVKRLVAFSIISNSGSGLLGKSPVYILEKYTEAMQIPEKFLLSMLDDTNKEKAKAYFKEWEIEHVEG
ncbi:hypothetical protein ES703_02144 [subsurface metagenome]